MLPGTILSRAFWLTRLATMSLLMDWAQKLMLTYWVTLPPDGPEYSLSLVTMVSRLLKPIQEPAFKVMFPMTSLKHTKPIATADLASLRLLRLPRFQVLHQRLIQA